MRTDALSRLFRAIRVPTTWLLLYYSLYVVWFILMPNGETKTAFSDFAYLPAESTALILGAILVIGRRDLDRRGRISWGCVCVARACRLVCATSWWWRVCARLP